jgi:hypothetical protein
MRVKARISLFGLAVAVVLVAWAPSAHAAGFGIEKFFAANCKAGFGECGEGAEEPTLKEAEEEGFTEAGGWVPFGITDFKLNTHEQTVPFPALIPNESVKDLRTDVAAGVVTNPEAIPKCSMKDFEATVLEPEKEIHSKSTCPASSIVGENIVETAVEVAPGVFKDFTLTGLVYNLEQAVGLASDFGVALDLAPLGLEAIFKQPVFSHTFIEGNVEWLSDYHDYFTIKDIAPGLVRSRLNFWGATEEGEGEPTGFLRNPSKCTAPGPETTTTISMESYGAAKASRPYSTLVGTEECLAEPFAPTFALTPETTAPDAPDGIAFETTMPHAEPEEGVPDTSDLNNAKVVLPVGMSMNPSAGAGLEGCTPEQIGLEPVSPDVSCPSGSRVGTVKLEVPTLPPGALSGPIFLGKPAGKQIEGPPYTIYLDAESARYGVKVRLKGTVTPDANTGQLTTTFDGNPQAPFNEAILTFKGGAFGAVANPLECTAYKAEAEFTPWSGGTAAFPSAPFSIEGCAASPPPFAPTQGTSNEPGQGGSASTFSFGLERPEGNQYLDSVSTTLPPGLVGYIPTVTQCPEPQASQGTCPAASQIGSVAVAAGSGTPYTFPGRVYLTGPYAGAPFGLSIVVPPNAGPFALPPVIARAKIEVTPDTAQVVVSDPSIPRIAGGIPTRIRALNLVIDRQGFERNPTNCSVFQTQSLVGGFTPGGATATATLSTPFQSVGCNALAFKPSFRATTGGKPSRQNGASLETTIDQPLGEAGIKSVLVTLPKQLPSRLTTLQKACLPQVFAANPFNCPVGSNVGGARANTPTLPDKLTGPAYLVARGGAQFPDLDLVLQADGVRVILKGNTDIKNGITTTNFAATPDAPISSITVNLPMGPHSALAAFGNLCTAALTMPTTITAQNGLVFKQNTTIKPQGCGVQIIGHKTAGNTAYMTVKTFEAGRVSGSGKNLSTVKHHYKGAVKKASLKVPLTPAARRKHKPLKVKVRIGFYPKKKGAPTSVAYKKVVFR